ncbi:DMT family transporter [Paracoccus suum]|uniref:DMT family transporter n=2 Tax=Paracoccus suum TaxID=2259340 RepID=A0A344PP57_9RHOB|nr:DMT family transporter [Paracoccus suum]
MLATGLTFVAMNGIVRHLGTGLPAAENAFLRFAFGLPLFLPTLIPALRRGFPRDLWAGFALRGALHCLGVIGWFYAMAHISLAEVTAIGYVNPVLVTIGAALLMGERLSWRRMVAIGVALVGMLIVLRPGLRALGSGHLAQLCAAAMFAASYLIAKRLVERTSPAVAVAMMTATVTLALAPIAAAVWVPPEPWHYRWLLLAAGMGSLGHYFMARAFAVAPMTVTQPVTFLQLIWASLLGTIVFGDQVDLFVILGGGLMIGAVSYITWREAARRSPITPPIDVAKGA